MKLRVIRIPHSTYVYVKRYLDRSKCTWLLIGWVFGKICQKNLLSLDLVEKVFTPFFIENWIVFAPLSIIRAQVPNKFWTIPKKLFSLYYSVLIGDGSKFIEYPGLGHRQGVDKIVPSKKRGEDFFFGKKGEEDFFFREKNRGRSFFRYSTAFWYPRFNFS